MALILRSSDILRELPTLSLATEARISLVWLKSTEPFWKILESASLVSSRRKLMSVISVIGFKLRSIFFAPSQHAYETSWSVIL